MNYSVCQLDVAAMGGNPVAGVTRSAELIPMEPKGKPVQVCDPGIHCPLLLVSLEQTDI